MTSLTNLECNTCHAKLGLKPSFVMQKPDLYVTCTGSLLWIVLITQYFDTLKDIGEKTGTSTVFVPHNPGALGAYSQQIRGTFK